jgi:dephospho-CoA kinase
MPFVVGMTGGIGSGKTTAAEAFARLGADLIDTDEIAHSLTAPGEPVLAQIARQFGPEMLTATGSLDRTKLREAVFAEPAQRERLEALLHPLIRSEVDRRLLQSRSPYVVLVVPLLIETGGYAMLVDRILVIDSPEHLQIERVMRRNRLRPEAIEAILRAQASRSERLARADDVLINDGTVAALKTGVEKLHRKYLALAADGRC